MLEFTRYSRGNFGYWIGIGLISPWLIAMKLGFLSKRKAKEKFLTFFFEKTDIAKFNEDCLSFSQVIMPRLVRPDALLAIKKHQAENTDIVIVSASAENWVAPWCIQNNLHYICTRLEVKEQKITGRLLGQNCNGPEKVSRIKERYDTAEYENIYCYGDSKDDKGMLQLATHPYYKIFIR